MTPEEIEKKNKKNNGDTEYVDFEQMKESEVLQYFEDKYNFKYHNLLKTSDAKKIYRQLISIFQSFFKTQYAKKKFLRFFPTLDMNEIKRRHELIEECLQTPHNDLDIDEFLNAEISLPKIYDVCFVTDNYKNYQKILEKYRFYPVFFAETKQDLEAVRDYAQIRTDSNEIANAIPSAILTEEPFPEYHVLKLYQIREILKKVSSYLNKHTKVIIDEINKFQPFDIDIESWLKRRIEEINLRINEKLRETEFKGEEVIKMLGGEVSEKLKNIIIDEIKKLEEEIYKKFNFKPILEHQIHIGFPIKTDNEGFKDLIRQIKSEIFYKNFQRCYEVYKKIGNADVFLDNIKKQLYELDFKIGIKNIIKKFYLEKPTFVENGFRFKNGRNLFLMAKNIDVEPVEYDIIDKKLILLTGANSGGKTTLLQLIAQILILALSGFYVPAKVELQIVEELYYFSKPTGRTDAGAFETLLKNFAKIDSPHKKLILADEIEAITEPGAAAKILIAILEWFKDKNAIVIIVTHLGDEIKHHVSESIRFDGIQAIGIEDNKLIVNRSPIKNIIAKSTPELIVEKLKDKDKFFRFVYQKLKEE